MVDAEGIALAVDPDVQTWTSGRRRLHVHYDERIQRFFVGFVGFSGC